MKSVLKLTKAIAAAVLAVAFVTECGAQPPGRPDGPPDRGGSAEGAGGPREGRRGAGGPREGRPGSGGPREGRGGPGGGGPGGPPSPERFVEHAMKFDVDADGKLDRQELTRFAEEIQRMRSEAGGRGGPGGRGREGRRPAGPGGGPDGEGAARPPVPE